MASFTPPTLNRDFVCVMPDDNPTVAAVVSSYFNEPGIYFTTFSFPAIDKPFAAHFDFSDDGYIARMIGSDAAVVINNAIVKLRPKKVFLAGMTSIQKSYIEAHIPKGMLIEIDSIIDVPKKLAFLNKTFEGTLLCKSSDVTAGLLHAKYSRKGLHIYEKAPTLAKKRLHNAKGLTVLEYTGESQDITAVNYAFSIDADVILVAPVRQEQVRPLQKLIYEWKNGSSEAYNTLRQKAAKRVKGINFPNYEFATFFTRGLPYGLLLKNVIPFSHVLTNIDSDLFIFNNIAYETIPVSFDTAIIFSPQLLGVEETQEIENVIAVLEKNNYSVKPLLCHIACFDSKHQGDFRTMASHGCPVVFNNTCSSWYEIAICFVQAGTRAYIGTLWKIGTNTARSAAKLFYEEVFNSGNMLSAFHKMVKSVKNNKYHDIYLYWGLHFSTMKTPIHKTDQKAFDALVASFLIWLNKYHETPTVEIRRNCVPILNFISKEIDQNFTSDHLKGLGAEIQSHLAKQYEQEPDDDFMTRGVMDL